MNSTTILLIFIFYFIVILILDKYGIFKKYNISAFGPILMIRTIRGQKFLDKLATPKKFWRIFANIGFPLMLIGMIAMFLVIILSVYGMIIFTPAPGKYNEPQNILFIPGINEYIPLVWGWIALIVTLVVHEFAHAILCKVEGIRVKSMGIILALIPIGGFAEPDEEQLFGGGNKKVATRTERMRILTAGVM
ncbi:MAG: site-2 protease family protein, partial [Methanosarcinales archaeon]